MPYLVFETRNFRKDLDKTVAAFEKAWIENKLSRLIYPELKTEPHYGPNIKKLKDYDPVSYRYRIGSFRLFYSIDEAKKTVVITAFRHRKEAYR